MISHKKISLYTLILFFSITSPTIAMEHTDLQLQNPREKNGIIYLDRSIILSHKTDKPIIYAPQKYHNLLCNQPSAINDPLAIYDIKEPYLPNMLLFMIPVKKLLNFSEKSVLQLHLKPNTISFNETSFKNKPICVNAKIMRNPKLENDAPQQLNDALDIFFDDPSAIDPYNTQELELAQIVTSKTIPIPSHHNGPSPFKTKRIYSHGPNSTCRNRPEFIRSIIDEKTLDQKAPENKNLLLRLKAREMNGYCNKID